MHLEVAAVVTVVASASVPVSGGMGGYILIVGVPIQVVSAFVVIVYSFSPSFPSPNVLFLLLLLFVFFEICIFSPFLLVWPPAYSEVVSGMCVSQTNGSTF